MQALRTEQDLTQAELASRAATTRATIARIEAGGVLPTSDSLERIGAALGVTLSTGFGGDGSCALSVQR